MSKAKQQQQQEEENRFSPLQYLKDGDILFCIFEDYEEREEADQADKSIYFYPELIGDDAAMNKEIKSLFGGGIISISGLTKDYFTLEPIQFLTLEKKTLAFKTVDKYNLVLCAGNEFPPSTILHHLNYIYNSLCFYVKGFQFIIKEKKRIEAELNEIMEILTINLNQNVMSAFNPIPYTPLPNRHQRIFIQATQLIDSIITPDHLGGAIFFRNTVLYSNLDLNSTKLLFDRVETIKRKNSMSPNHLPENSHQTVFIKPSEYINLLNKHPNNAFQVPQPHQQPQQQQQQQSKHPFGSDDKESDLISVELLILYFTELTIALFTESHYSKQQTIHLEFNKVLLNHKPKITQLEKDLELAFDIRTLSASNSSPPQIAFHTNIQPSQNFHFLSYDSLTNMSMSSGITTANDMTFINTCTGLHDTFIENPEITQMFLRNNNGELFCKKQFGREVYYQPKVLFSNIKFNESPELLVQSHLKDYNINIL
ncbi:hypothetical protein DLAC_03067 [Tieghemostelium lacteum]|uniref:CCZ1/INTU/HSP4 first Longin domain-containing protein n=1 Tax=Tieghemostelium lacteum TaxID=361077 RepID=A0A152A296_TIELA|nr:hypothetical protein DLAC_03067 [Tieghemostelium lacteum]|eukprot:KYR00324.1 hypothetical protein DLAC_03067 [Tieghemostelium lacteum]